MPFEAIASAIWRTALSSTVLLNLFQLFHPMGGVFASPLYFTAGKSLEREIFGAGIAGRSVETRVAVSTVGGRSPSFGMVTFNPSPASTAVQSTRFSTPEDSRIKANEIFEPFTCPSGISMVARLFAIKPLRAPPSSISATVVSRFCPFAKVSEATQRPVKSSAEISVQPTMERATRIFILAIILRSALTPGACYSEDSP